MTISQSKKAWLFSCLCVIFLTVSCVTKALTYQWPLSPFNSQHRVTATYGEYREAPPYPHFHKGVDIHDIGTSNVPVYPVVDGIVSRADALQDFVDVQDDFGNIYRYIHLENIQISVNDDVEAGVDTLGYIATGSSTHLHFQDGENGYETNPLAFTYTLQPFADTTKPLIESIWTEPDEMTGIDTVYGKVDIMARAWDSTSYPGGVDLNNGVFLVCWWVKDESGNLIESEECNLRFDGWLSFWELSAVYASGSNNSTYNYISTNGMAADWPYYWDTQNLDPGEYQIFVKVEDTCGNADTSSIWVYVSVGVKGRGTSGPPSKAFSLSQNYPNPFNPETELSFTLPVPSFVNLSVYNIKGQLVRRLVNKYEKPGSYIVHWDGRDKYRNPVASGVYLYQIKAGIFTQTRKMVIIR